jgi:hypothetical protein
MVVTILLQNNLLQTIHAEEARLLHSGSNMVIIEHIYLIEIEIINDPFPVKSTVSDKN